MSSAGSRVCSDVVGRRTTMPARDTTEETMTTTPSEQTTRCRPPRVTWPPGRPPVTSSGPREGPHREGDARAARRLPMVELDGTIEVVGPDGGRVLDCSGRDELWSTTRCGTTARAPGTVRGLHLTSGTEGRVYLNAAASRSRLTRAVGRGGSSRVHGLHQRWYSVRGVEAPLSQKRGTYRFPARR